MATHRVIASTETDPEAPLTSSLAKAWADNVEAIREGDPTAPKVQPNALRRITLISPAAAQLQPFTGLGSYGAVEFEVHVRNTSSNSAFNFQYSTDGGSTWSTAQSMGTLTGTTGAAILSGSFDFATGQLDVIATIYDVNSAATPTLTRTSAALAGASLAIDAIRFAGVLATCTSIAIVRPAGATQ